MECLGVQITVGGLTTEEIKEGRRLLNAMKRAALADEIDVWSTLHRRFHAILVARSGAFVGRTIATYAAQSERYWRVYRSTHPSPLVSRHSEHERLLMAVTAGDRAEAGNLMAEHLSTTALAVLADIDPDFSPESVRCAVDLVATRAYGGRQTRPDPQTVDGPF